MAKESWHYQTTSAKWAAAQARGYLLESSASPQSSNKVHRENGVTAWTSLSKGYVHTIYEGVICNVLLRVMYEVKSTDYVLHQPNVGLTVCATGQIPLSDVTVLSTTMFGGGGSGSESGS